MKTLVDDRLRDEARRFSLRFACEDCVHVADGFPGAAPSCSLAYPAAPRRNALAARDVEFCKSFELA